MADTYQPWTARSGYTSGANQARLGRVSVSGIPCMLFADDVDQTYFLKGIMPAQWDGLGSFDFQLIWNFATFAASQTCQWQVSWAKLEAGVDDFSTLTYATAKSVLANAPGTTLFFAEETINFLAAEIDGVTAGMGFVIRIVRDSTLGTASPGDAQVTDFVLEKA